ncbi:MAG: hypothetical protein ACO3Y3_10770 [Phycisphaerales bacterium]
MTNISSKAGGGACISMALALASGAAHGEMVLVEIAGTVEFNQVSAPPIGSLTAGTAVVLSFLLDSDDFVNSPNYPTRGYVIDQASFSLAGGGVSVGLQSPFPGGEVPYFVIRNDDPAVDGFFIARSVDFPIGVPLGQTGFFDTFSQDFSVTYGGGLLESLDILDAVGTYGFGGLKGYNWTIDDGPASPVSIGFESISISVVPSPATSALLAIGAGLTRRRRR